MRRLRANEGTPGEDTWPGGALDAGRTDRRPAEQETNPFGYFVVARSAVPQTPRDHYLFLSLCNFLYYLGASVADWQTPRAD